MDDADVKKLIDQTASRTGEETRKHFEAVSEGFERKIDSIVEAVTLLDKKLDRQADEIRGDMGRGFAETQAMIRFSHAELDRRVRALEDAFAELRARVDRLEETPH